MKGFLRQLGKDTVIYGLGGILSRALGFFLLPVYTRLFTLEEYGLIEMVAVIVGFVNALVVLGQDSAQSFFFFEEKDQGEAAQARVVSAILQLKLTWGVFVVALATLASPLLNAAFTDGVLEVRHFAVAFAGGLFLQIMLQGAEVYRLRYRPAVYIAITLTQTVVGAGVTVALVAVFDMGIFGYFLGAASACVVAGAVAWWTLRGMLQLHTLHRDWFRRLLRFGLPLAPASFAIYVMSSADRWFVMEFEGREALGLYAVGAKFALLLAVAVTTFRQAWWPVALDALRGPDGPPLVRGIARAYLGVAAVGMIVLSGLSVWLVDTFTDDAYTGGYVIVGILGWASILYGFNMIGALGVWKAEKTGWQTTLMMGAAALNVLLDLVLVPPFGIVGAAAATVASYVAWNIGLIAVGERLFRIGYDYAALATLTAFGIAASSAITWMHTAGFGALPIAAATAGSATLVGWLALRGQVATLRRLLRREPRP